MPDSLPASEHSRSAPLDGLRGLAVLLVLFHHTIVFEFPEFGGRLTQIVGAIGDECWVGVDLFFVLSGFLITRILLRAKRQPGYYARFYARRTLRIFPLYYLFLVVAFGLLPRLFPDLEELHREGPHQLWYWLYVPNLRIFLQDRWLSPFVDQTWSLAIEEQFYLVWPFLVATLPETALVLGAAAVIPASLVLRVLMSTSGHSEAAIRALTFSHVDGLMLGAIFAILVVRQVPVLRIRRLSGGLLVLGLVSRALVLHVVKFELASAAFFVTSWSLTFAGVLGLVVASSSKTWLTRFFSLRPLVTLGTYSYGLYLFHQPLFLLVHYAIDDRIARGPPGWLSLGLIAGPLSLALAVALFRFYETPFLRLKQRFAS